MHATIDKRALIQERGNDSGGEGSSINNMSLPYIPSKVSVNNMNIYIYFNNNSNN